MTLTTKILIAMLLGIVAGTIINLIGIDHAFIDTFVLGGILKVVGSIFIASLKMMVVPLVFVSLVIGVTKLGDIHALGRIGVSTILLYLVTTAIAITIALSLAHLISPGSNQTEIVSNASYQAKAAPPLSDVLINIIPSNPIAAMTNGNMLQIIVFAILFGIALMLTGKRSQPVLKVLDSLDSVVMQMVMIIMKLAPFGVFCLVTKTFATEGFDVIWKLISYFAVVALALLIHATLTFSLLLRFLAKLNPLIFFQKIRAALVFAFSTASSNATIPVTLRTAEERLGVKNSVASFTVPLGATINMDGTAIMQGVATVFIANVYGIDLSITDFLTVILTATLASIGTAGVPGVGLIMLALVLAQAGLPVEGISLIIGVDRLLDMMRTAVNVTGDCVITSVIARKEKAIDDKVFQDPNAGMIKREA